MPLLGSVRALSLGILLLSALAPVAAPLLRSGELERHKPTILAFPLPGSNALAMLPDTLWRGLLVVRTVEDSSRSLWEGRLAPASKEHNSSYLLQGTAGWQVFLTSDFFTSRNDAAERRNPVAETAWDGWLLHIPGVVDSAFYQDSAGVVQGLARLAIVPPVLRIGSSPSGAKVSVDGVYQGTTPVALSFSGNQVVTIQANRDGYFGWEDVAILHDGEDASLNLELAPRPTFQDGSWADRDGEDAFHTKDLHAIRKLMDAEVRARPKESEHFAAVRALKARMDTLRTRLYPAYFQPSYLALDEWDSTLGGVKVTTWISENNLDFGFDGLLRCTREDAAALKLLLENSHGSSPKELKNSHRIRRTSWPAAHTIPSTDGYLRVLFHNRIMVAKKQYRDVQRYYSIEALELVLPTKTWRLEGQIEYPAYIRRTVEWIQPSNRDQSLESW